MCHYFIMIHFDSFINVTLRVFLFLCLRNMNVYWKDLKQKGWKTCWNYITKHLCGMMVSVLWLRQGNWVSFWPLCNTMAKTMKKEKKTVLRARPTLIFRFGRFFLLLFNFSKILENQPFFDLHLKKNDLPDSNDLILWLRPWKRKKNCFTGTTNPNFSFWFFQNLGKSAVFWPTFKKNDLTDSNDLNDLRRFETMFQENRNWL